MTAHHHQHRESRQESSVADNPISQGAFSLLREFAAGMSNIEEFQKAMQRARQDYAQAPPPKPQADLNALFDQAIKSALDKPNQIQKLPNGAVYFRAKMNVDADGSPRIKKIDPHAGNAKTTLRYPDGSYVNAETMPYIVLPRGKYASLNLRPGDLAAVRYNGILGFPVFADVGPQRKLGEGSMALAQELNMPTSPLAGGVDAARVEYLVFPGSGDRTPGTKESNAERAQAALRAYAEKSNGGDQPQWYETFPPTLLMTLPSEMSQLLIDQISGTPAFQLPESNPGASLPAR
jgi:hypothetical protein